MSDIALKFDSAAGLDFAIKRSSSGLRADLESDDGLRTAVLVSLFLDSRADTDDVLPFETDDRRGWWADEFGAAPGSKLWLLARSKALPDVAQRAEDYARQALQWMIDEGVARQIDVTSTVVTTPYRALTLEVVIYRPEFADPTRFPFGAIWRAEAERI